MEDWEKEFDYDRGFVGYTGFLNPSIDAGEVKEFISRQIQLAQHKEREKIKSDLLKIADKGEKENLRWEIENYFNN